MTDRAPPVVYTFEDDPTLFLFWCPGCGYGHHIDTKRWQFNGDLRRPTVSPSLLINADKRGGSPRCHLFVREGRLQFLGDCTHALAGKTVEMVPYP